MLCGRCIALLGKWLEGTTYFFKRLARRLNIYLHLSFIFLSFFLNLRNSSSFFIMRGGGSPPPRARSRAAARCLRPTPSARRRRGLLDAGCCFGARANFKEGPFSAVSNSTSVTKYPFETSRRDLHQTVLCTVLQSQFLSSLGEKLLHVAESYFRYFAENECQVAQLIFAKF